MNVKQLVQCVLHRKTSVNVRCWKKARQVLWSSISPLPWSPSAVLSPPHLPLQLSPALAPESSNIRYFCSVCKKAPSLGEKGNAPPARTPGLAKACQLVFSLRLPFPSWVPLWHTQTTHTAWGVSMILKLIDPGDDHRKHSTLFSRQKRSDVIILWVERQDLSSYWFHAKTWQIASDNC